jgi:hypothetical protein
VIDLVVRVLLIGNSLTLANDLPAMIRTLGAAAGVRIECAVVAEPGFSLQDHWDKGEASRAIARGGWTFVVMQQGPSALPESQRQLRDSARRFDAVIRSAGAAPVFYMVWPSRDRLADFPAVSRSYTSAAEAVHATLAAAGDAWRDAWRRDPALALYGDDGFHPSRLGSLLAAMVIVETLTGRRVPETALVGVPAHERAVVSASAASVMR